MFIVAIPLTLLVIFLSPTLWSAVIYAFNLYVKRSVKALAKRVHNNMPLISPMRKGNRIDGLRSRPWNESSSLGEVPYRISFPLLELQIGHWRPGTEYETSFEIEMWKRSSDVALKWIIENKSTKQKQCIVVASTTLTAIDVYRPYPTSVM